MNGKHFELMVIRFVRAAQGKGLADLMAARKTDWGHPEVCLVSCTIHGKWNPKEKQDLLAAAEKTGATAFLASRGPHYLLKLDRLEVS